MTNPILGIQCAHDNLYVLASGGRCANPTQLIETAGVDVLLHELRKHFDVIIIDSPPVGAVSDSLYLAEIADDIIFVCRFNKAHKKHIRAHYQQLVDLGHAPTGILINGMTSSQMPYYTDYQHYRSRYYRADR